MNDDKLYISLHIPKTCGTTFKQILKKQFGPHLQLAQTTDKTDIIVEHPTCLHGHFVLKHYSDLVFSHPHPVWITFLREPLASAISSYYYIRLLKLTKGNHIFTDNGLTDYLTNNEIHRWPDPPGYSHNRYKKMVRKVGSGYSSI